MGPDGSASQLGGQAGVVTDTFAGTLQRFDLAAQLVGAAGGGGYVMLGATVRDGRGALGGRVTGAVYRRRFDHGLGLTLRGGLLLPTASDDSTLLASIASTRPNELLTSRPRTTALRLAASPTLHHGHLVARADVGVDLVVDGPSYDPGAHLDTPFVHAAVGAGYHDGRRGLVGEVTSLRLLEAGEHTLYAAAVTGETTLGRSTAYLSVAHELADDPSGDVDRATSVLVGVRARP